MRPSGGFVTSCCDSDMSRRSAIADPGGRTEVDEAGTEEEEEEDGGAGDTAGAVVVAVLTWWEGSVEEKEGT